MTTAAQAPAASDHQEIEWQFDTPDLEAVARWLAAPRGAEASAGVEARPGPTLHLRDSYFDTADWRITRAGYSLRIRDTGDWREATLKARAEAVDGLRRRRELNEPLTPDIGAPTEAPGLVGEHVRLLAGAEPLLALFTLENRRRTVRLAVGGVEAGEVTLDETTAPRPDGTLARLERVEVEARPEHVVALESFVGELRAACNLRPATIAKMAFGLTASGRLPPDPILLGSREIDPAMSVGAFAFAVLRRHFAALLAHEAGTRLGEDVEELHDMRVATRRLRALLALFADVLPVRAQTWRRELGWLAAVLGAVRDRDVELAALAAWQADADATDLAAVSALVAKERARARMRLLRALDSRRYRRLVASGVTLLQGGPVRRSLAAREPAITALPPLIQRRYRKLRRAAEAITSESPPEAYHRLRIHGKRLRYAVEPAVDLFGGPARTFARRLSGLQDLLGRHQDAYVAIGQLAGYRDRGGRRITPRVAFLLGRLAERATNEAAQARRAFPETYEAVTGRSWKRLRRALGL